ncbi:MAG: HAD family hydrolase [Lentisphaerae bacterium]|nr:HAD family hydrolase [Lentisphaerota bacterium]
MNARVFDGVIFDMDGTLTRPSLDFAAIRRELNLPAGDIAHQVQALPPVEQRAAWAIIEAHEARARADQALQPGAEDLLRDCRQRDMRVGLITRNDATSVAHLCERFGLTFDAVVTREFPVMKPHPDTVRHILEQWALPADRVLMVGDYVHDLDCGRAAGTATCFFFNSGHTDYSAQADFVVRSMDELGCILWEVSEP